MGKKLITRWNDFLNEKCGACAGEAKYAQDYNPNNVDYDMNDPNFQGEYSEADELNRQAMARMSNDVNYDFGNEEGYDDNINPNVEYNQFQLEEPSAEDYYDQDEEGGPNGPTAQAQYEFTDAGLEEEEEEED